MYQPVAPESVSPTLAAILASTVALMLVAVGIPLVNMTVPRSHSGGTNSAGCYTRDSDNS